MKKKFDFSKVVEFDLITLEDCDYLFKSGLTVEINDGRIVGLVREKER